jgi:hypothetical protein
MGGRGPGGAGGAGVEEVAALPASHCACCVSPGPPLLPRLGFALPGVNALMRGLTQFIDSELRVTHSVAAYTVQQSGFRDLMSTEERQYLDGQPRVR